MLRANFDIIKERNLNRNVHFLKIIMNTVP